MPSSKKKQLLERSQITRFFTPAASPSTSSKTPVKISKTPKKVTKTPLKRKAVVLEPLEPIELSSDEEIIFIEPIKLNPPLKKVKQEPEKKPVKQEQPEQKPVIIKEELEVKMEIQEMLETVLENTRDHQALGVKDEDMSEDEGVDREKIEAEISENIALEEQYEWGEDEGGRVDSDPERDLGDEDWNEPKEEEVDIDSEIYREESAFLDQMDEDHIVVQGSSKDHDKSSAATRSALAPSSKLKMKSEIKSTKTLSTLPSFANPFPIAPFAKDPPPPNAFTALMSGNRENKAWKDAEKSDNLRGRLPAGVVRTVPFYKWVEGMEITVDAFKYSKIAGCKAYFLSHAHSDHYQNLSSSWSAGPVYCSVTTANLIKLKLNVKDEYLKPLAMNVKHIICGISVTLIDANHCPGSTIFLFEGPHTDPRSTWSKYPKKIFRYLHCGDFRASPAHLAHPALIGKKIDICYLDTTYLDPKYCFPAQDLVIEACATLVTNFIKGDGDTEALRVGGVEEQEMGIAMKGWLGKGKAKEESPVHEVEKKEKSVTDWITESASDIPILDASKSKDRWLVVVGTYSVGKERIVKGIAQALNTKIYANPTKMKLLKAQDDPLLHSLLTTNPLAAQVHVVFLSDINHEKLSVYLSQYRKMQGGFDKLIGLRPSGWTYKPEKTSDKAPLTVAKIIEREKQRKFSPAGMIPQRDSKPGCLAYGVPYSEHSSMFELCCFALSLNYVKMIPTVNIAKAESRNRMNVWFEKWVVEKKRRKDLKLEIVARNPNYW